MLGSRSAFEPLRRGQRMACEPSNCRGGPSTEVDAIGDGPVTLRALPGPQADWFDAAEFFGPTFDDRARRATAWVCAYGATADAQSPAN